MSSEIDFRLQDVRTYPYSSDDFSHRMIHDTPS